MNAIRMTVIPLVVSPLITGVASLSDLRTVWRIGLRSLALFVALLASVGLMVALIGAKRRTEHDRAQFSR